MSIRLTIDVFSGRPNPAVDLEDREAQRLLERLRPMRLLDREESPPPPPVLGYRGILVEQLETVTEELPKRFRLAEGQAFGYGLAHRVADQEVEDYLLGEDGPFTRRELPEDFFERLPELRKEYREWWVRWPWEPPIIIWPWPKRCPCGPLYEPGWWNVPGRQPYNNCYNYSTNYRTNTFAQPGRAAGAQYTSLTCAAVRPAAIADALIDAPDADNHCPEEGHLVALVVAPGWDYHWYRKDRTGWWSHKPGSTAATNRDNAGNLIRDPRTAARGPYTDFCTFMVVMHGHIRIS